MKVYLFLFLLFTFITTLHGFFMSIHDFNQYKDKYSKRYKSIAEEEKHFYQFQINKDRIQYLNQCIQSYKLGINEFTDQNVDKIIKNRLHQLHIPKIHSNIHLSHGLENQKNTSLVLDWNKKGFVSPIKNQGNCGSCWAFSTIGAIESMVKINTGKEYRLSEQYLIDCNKKNSGCKGGLMHHALHFIRKSKGVLEEKDYPYRGIESECHESPILKVPETKNFRIVKVKTNSPLDLKKCLQKNPVCMALDANSFEFLFYHEGIFDKEFDLEKDTLNHAVLLTGIDENEKSWTIKNSWGKSWGDQGYMHLKYVEEIGTAGMYLYGFVPFYKEDN